MNREKLDWEKTVCLVREAQKGDRVAVNSLFARYAPRVYRIVALRIGRSVGDSRDIEDIAQEALIKAFQGLGRFEQRSEGSFRNWLARCVESTIADHFRHVAAQKRGRGKVRRFGDCNVESIADLVLRSKDPTPSQIAQADELESKIEGALLKMAKHQREVIILHRLCQMSYKEVAETMGFEQEGTARQACARALQKLKQEIETGCNPPASRKEEL